MRKVLVVLVLIGLVVSANLYAENSPASAEKHPAVAESANTKQETVGTEKNPAVVKLLNTGKTEAESAQETKALDKTADQTERLAEYTNKLADYTLWSIRIGIAQTFALVVTFLVSAFVAVRQLRAYVSARPEFIFNFDNEKYACIKYKMENVGLTPAHDLSHGATIDVFPFPLPEDFSSPEVQADEKLKIVLFPNLPFYGSMNARRYFTKEEIDGIKNGSLRIYIFGVMKYKDIFSQRRQTKFSASVKASSATIQKLTTNYEKDDLVVDFEATNYHNAIS